MDFRTLDFERLWAGRSLTTAVERSVVADLLGPQPWERVLEVGPGAGRLTDVVASHGREYVALDLHREFLARLPVDATPAHVLRVEADARRAPLNDGTFDLIVAVRIFNFFADPPELLREFHRLLRPGGRLLLGYQPRPSVATLVDDVRNALHGRRPPGAPTMTFGRGDRISAQPSSFPAWLSTRSYVRSALSRAGFRVDRSVSTGAEDYALGRRLPARLFARAAPLADRLAIFPTQFVWARRLPDASGPPFPDWEDMLRCSRCGTAYGAVSWSPPRDIACAACGDALRVEPGWLLSSPTEGRAAQG